MSARENAEKLRAEYKAKGWNSKKISVRVVPVTYSMSIEVTVRSLEVDFKAAKEMAEEYSNARTCEASGETLLGGNTYVSVEWDKKVSDPIVAGYAEKIRPLAINESVEIDGITVTRENENEFSLYRYADGIGHMIMARPCAWGAEGAADGIFWAKWVKRS
jgi:hypothetical protein